jgi:hypothetical protein
MARIVRSMVAMAMVIIALGAAITRVASAGVSVGDLRCCCGVHAGDEDCGCPDCPVADSDHNKHKAPSDAPSFKRCGAPSHFVALMTIIEWAPATQVRSAFSRIEIAAMTKLPNLIPIGRAAPDSPPPR